jgi:hypothetical protein
MSGRFHGGTAGVIPFLPLSLIRSHRRTFYLELGKQKGVSSLHVLIRLSSYQWLGVLGYFPLR